MLYTEIASPALWARKISGGKFKIPRHIAYIDDVVVRAITGQGPRRIVCSIPPRFGKSYYISEHLPAWYAGMFPDNHVVLTSYEADFAASWGAKSRDLLANSEDNFLGVRIDPLKKSANHWKIAGHRGGVSTAGAGGALTGKGAHLLIIDDPIKNSEEAQSETQRNKLWDWFRSTAYTRIEPGGVCIIVQCMTGDTSVLMGDGTCKRLDKIQKGDIVASYDSGSIVESNVLNWKSQGLDECYEIKTKRGLTAKANARHPFLVNENGVMKWVRLKDLRAGDVLQVASGGSGKELTVHAEARYCPVDARACAGHATIKANTRPAGVEGAAKKTELLTSSTDTELQKTSTTSCLQAKDVCVQYAVLGQKNAGRSTGGDCVSTIATTREQLEGFYATDAILLSDTATPRTFSEKPLSTLSVSSDEIESITPIGMIEVFDIQVEGTECFIANGLISHNTRWHQDDLAGKVISELSSVEPWEVISFPAIAEEQDVLGRKPGEALWPERRPLEELLKIKSTVGPYWWSALYQQRPTPAEGGLFKLEFFDTFYESYPKIRKACRFWDLAATKGVNSDYTVGLLLGLSEDDNFYVLDIVRGKWEPYERDRIIRQVAELDGYDTKIRMEKEPGASGESLIDAMGRKLTGFNFRGIRSRDSKMARVNSIDGVASIAGVGRLRICKALWTRDFLDELIMFPNGSHDDQVDALSGAYKALTQEKQVFVA